MMHRLEMEHLVCGLMLQLAADWCRGFWTIRRKDYAMLFRFKHCHGKAVVCRMQQRADKISGVRHRSVTTMHCTRSLRH